MAEIKIPGGTVIGYVEPEELKAKEEPKEEKPKAEPKKKSSSKK